MARRVLKLRLGYEVESGGWAVFRVADAQHEIVVTASHLHDSLRELIEAASLLLSGELKAETTFVEEPSQVVLTFGPAAGSEVPLTLIRYPDWPQRRSTDAKELLQTRTPLKRLAEQIAALADQISVDLGEAEYERRSKVSFPMESLRRLRSRLGHHP